MINILHLIDHYRIGGPGKTIINSSRFINCTMFKIHIASFLPPTERKTDLISAAESFSIPHLKLYDKRGLNPTIILELLRYIRDNDINILHTHGYKADFIGLIVKSICKPLTLVTIHHGWITNNARQKLYIKLDLFLSRFFDGVITVSDSLYNMLPEVVKKKDKSTVINNAIVLTDYEKDKNRHEVRSKYGIDVQETAIGVIGRLSVEKGCLDMLCAFNEIIKVESRTKLIFVGEGPLFIELKRKIESQQLSDRAILIGYHSPIQPIYEALDILVCPSHTEGLSNVILEAMAKRLPIVATRVGGTSEVICDHVNGLLVDSQNPVQLASAVLKLIKDPKLLLTISSRGEETVRTKYTFQERMLKIEEFYLFLLQNS